MKDEITLSEIDRLAELSALRFTDEEKTKLLKEIPDIIKMLNECDKVKTDKVKNDNIHNLDDLREDVVIDGLTNAEALANAPKERKGYFNVPKVVD